LKLKTLMAQFRLLILLAIIFPWLALAQVNKVQGFFSPKKLKQDADALRTALEKHHPGLHWYTSKEEFNSAWDSLDQKLTQPLTELEFFRLLLPVVAKVECAHTLFYPSSSIMAIGTRFPIDIKLIGDKIYLMPDSSIYNIPRGSELISINNKPTEAVLHQLMPNLQAQGGNRGWKKAILENDFQNYYYYTIEQSAQFLVKYINYKTGQQESKVIDGSSDELLRKHWKNWYPVTDGPPLKIQYAENSALAILTIKSLVRGRAKIYNQDFDKLINQYFEEINKRGIKKLIIDVRGNEGGNNPEKLYSYLAKVDAPSKESNTKSIGIRPSKNSFEGPVIVLANERSISAQETLKHE
jgi:hypothetical protein